MRPFWIGLGYISLTVGAAGAMLPLLPTTPFLILALYAFSRGSPGVESWLLVHPRWGPLLRDWRHERAIARGVKKTSLAVILATPLVTWLLGAGPLVLATHSVVLICVGLFIATRPVPSKGQIEADE